MSYDHEPCIGVLGGGQLGRMLALEARRMGYRVLQWTGGDSSGAERLADIVISKPFDDASALEEFVTKANYATVEFENIPRELMDKIAERIPLMPSANALSICQHREREKSFLADKGIPTAKFQIVENAAELTEALKSLACDVIIKTCQFGYDGKGQMAVGQDSTLSAEEIWKNFEGGSAIVEQKINLASELSVMVARGQDGTIVTYDPAENIHKDHILHLSIVPARIPEALQKQAQSIALKVAEGLEYIGILGVEFFVDQSGNLLVNEMACRPHNSGHHTLDGCVTSQFEQQLRVVAGLPLGSTELLKPTVMLNLLGDIWHSPSEAPDWAPVLSIPGATLHLYGKSEAKAKRKVGHINFIADTVEQALQNAQSIIQKLGI